jgi:hypothetical protein
MQAFNQRLLAQDVPSGTPIEFCASAGALIAPEKRGFAWNRSCEAKGRLSVTENFDERKSSMLIGSTNRVQALKSGRTICKRT